MRVTKRDGRLEDFSVDKLAGSLLPVAKDEADAAAIANAVAQAIDDATITSAEISSLVSKHLDAAAANAYKLEQSKREAAREKNGYVFNRLRTLTHIDSSKDTGMRENANINADSAMGMMLKAGADTMKHYYLSEVIDHEFAEAHRDGHIHIHDLDFYGMTATCLQINLDKLFENGFTTGHGTVRTPQSIRNYWSLLCIIIQANQNDMHGGQAIPALEYYLAPGVAKSFARILANIVIDGIGKRDLYGMNSARRFRDAAMERIYPKANTLLNDNAFTELSALCKEFYNIAPTQEQINSACLQVVDECLQGAEACIHNLCTMASRAGAQVPFSSINYGTGTSQEQRIVISCILQALSNGLGNGETQIFPIHIFKVKDGVNYKPGDPNYDLFRKAIEVTAKRMFPNFEFLDAPFNLQYYKEGDPDTEVATMGCVARETEIAYRYKGINLTDTFEKLFSNMLSNGHTLNMKGETDYFVFTDGELEVYDSFAANYVKVKVLLRNHNVDGWKRIWLSNSRYITVTNDHPLPVVGKGRTYANELQQGDLLWESRYDKHDAGTVEILQINDLPERNGDYSYDVETESDHFDILGGVVSHNCRTRVMGNVNGPATTSCRGNLSFTTINLPHLALEAKGDSKVFFELLDKYIDLCVRQLLERFRIQVSRHVYNFPMLFGNHMYMGSENMSDTDTLFDALKHGTLSVGFVGLAEALKALVGCHHGESLQAQELGLKIVGLMRQRMDEATARHHLNFTLLATPAESTAGTLLKKDRKVFGIVPGVTDKEYYTNSNHIPVWYEISAKRKIELEAPYHALCNAGHIAYVEYGGDPTQNLEAVESIVRWMHDANVGYGAINRAIDTCQVCGYSGIFEKECPECGNNDQNKILRLRRVTGYLVGDRNKRFNDAKLAEERDRVKHSV